MANAYALNFPIPGGTNIFQCIWKLTRVMKKSGWTTVSHSNGSTKTASGTNGNDSWGTNADPLLDSYPSFDAAAPWIVMRGPSTLKIPLSAAPTGTPLRGENITQAVSSATGELMGYVWDASGLSGWMVISPRTGTFDNSHTITGSSSSATLVPTGTIVTYVREMMFAKPTAGNNTDGQLYYICADVAAENAQLFSVLASSSGCTAVIPPASGGTGNSFPALAIALRGTGGSTTIVPFIGGYSSGFAGSSQQGCSNATSATGISADGSFYCIANNSGSAIAYAGFLFTRVDDGEPGDVDPYVMVIPHGNVYSSFSRTASSTYGIQPATFMQSNLLAGSSYPSVIGYQARGCPVTARDVVTGFTVGITSSPFTGSFASTSNYPIAMRVTNHPATTTPLIREPFLIFNSAIVPSTLKMFKGRTRWMHAFSQGAILDTFDSKNYVGVTSVGSASIPCIAIGPWDGTTTPSA